MPKKLKNKDEEELMSLEFHQDGRVKKLSVKDANNCARITVCREKAGKSDITYNFEQFHKSRAKTPTIKRIIVDVLSNCKRWMTPSEIINRIIEQYPLKKSNYIRKRVLDDLRSLTATGVVEEKNSNFRIKSLNQIK